MKHRISRKNCVVLEAVSYARWYKEHYNKQGGIIIADIDDSRFNLMVGTVVCEPNSRDDELKEELKPGTENILFDIYGVAPLSGQEMRAPGQYVCHLDFVYGKLETLRA